MANMNRKIARGVQMYKEPAMEMVPAKPAQKRVKRVICGNCKWVKPAKEIHFHCPRCRKMFLIEYDYAAIKREIKKNKEFMNSGISHWKYWMFYPLSDFMNVTTLHEG